MTIRRKSQSVQDVYKRQPTVSIIITVTPLGSFNALEVGSSVAKSLPAIPKVNIPYATAGA